MHSFLFVRFRKASAKALILDRIARNAAACLSFEPERLTVNQVGADALLLSAEASRFWRLGSYSLVSEGEAFAFDGLPLFRDGPPGAETECTAAALAFMLDANADGLYESLFGQFCLLRYRGGRLIAFGDSSGSRPLYFLQTSDWSAVANRQSLLSPACTRDGRRDVDIAAAAWAISQLHVFGEASIYDGVRLLPPGRRLSLDGEGVLVTSAQSVSIWSGRGAKRRLEQADYDAIADDLGASYSALGAAIARTTARPSLSITGGKDSRLGLALALKAGMEGLELFTYGTENNPEIQAARALCAIVRKPHKSIVGDPRKDLDIGEIWKRLRFAAFRFDFSHGGVDGGYSPHRDTSMGVDLTGSFADIFRRIWPHSRESRFATLADALKVWVNWPVSNDALGIVKRHVKEDQQRRIEFWMRDRLDSGFDLNDLQEIFYVENRMTWWLGAINATNLAKLRVVPMSSLKTSRLGMLADAEDRERERLHFETLRRLSPALLRVPFLNDVWHKDIRSENAALGVAVDPFVVQPYASSNVSSWPAFLCTEGKNTVREYLLDAPDSALWDIVDQERLRLALENPQTPWGAVQVRQIINCILVRMALSGDYGAAKDDVRSHPRATHFETNIPGFQIEQRTRLADGRKTHRSLEKLYRFSLAARAIRSIRLDPSNAPGIIKIASVSLVADHITHRLDLSTARTNGDLRVIQLNGAGGLYVSCGEDPQLIFSGLALSDLESAELRVLALIENGAYMDAHWDDGSGFSAERRRRIQA